MRRRRIEKRREGRERERERERGEGEIRSEGVIETDRRESETEK